MEFKPLDVLCSICCTNTTKNVTGMCDECKEQEKEYKDHLQQVMQQ